MANYYASCRSNYFNVKDEQAFIDWTNTLPDVECQKEGAAFALFGINPDGGGWPSEAWNEEEDEYVEMDIMAGLAPHLAEGEVAVFMEVGAEKLRYLVGYAVAVSWTGEVVQVSLEDIYEKAANAFVGCNKITTCEY